jgi:two-component system response regulator YesN
MKAHCASAHEHPELEVNWRSFDYYPPLARVRSFIDMTYKSDLSLPRVAEVAGMQPSYFSAFFHRKVGVRLTDWIWYVRITQAKRLLATSDGSISGIALAVGFANLRTFERTFKRVTKITPREFKRAARPAESSVSWD